MLRIRHGPARWPRRAMFSRALIPEAHVDVDERTCMLAPRRRRPRDQPAFEQACRLRLRHRRHDATKQSFSWQHRACPTCCGNCNDIHALVRLAVPIGRHPGHGFQLGQAFELLQPGAQDRGARRHHGGILRRWAGLATGGRLCATKYGTHGPVREPCRPTTRVSIGDILLAPPLRAACSSPAPTSRLTANTSGATPNPFYCNDITDRVSDTPDYKDRVKAIS